MEKHEIEYLEKLLQKYESHVGKGNRVVISISHLVDCPFVGIYDNNGGLLKGETSHNLLSATDKLLLNE